jgi:hypothetical protein
MALRTTSPSPLLRVFRLPLRLAKQTALPRSHLPRPASPVSRRGPAVKRWQGQRESNPQPSVLETDALPVELYPYVKTKAESRRTVRHIGPVRQDSRYSRILATTPAPTVRPPSRMAKRRPSSIAIGLISWTVIDTLSPGMTISLSFGSSIAPVTSVVRK